jgi:hypothetical protein
MSRNRTDPRAQALQAARKIRTDFQNHQIWAEETLSVRNKQGLLIPYRMGPAQLKLIRSIEAQRKKGIPPRILFLKARQVWGSTALAGYFFHRIAFTPGQEGYILAHLKENAEVIFNYYKTFVETYQPFRGIVRPETLIRPPSSRSIEWEKGSSIHVKTAENLRVGRGFKARFLHLSEYAFYRDSKVLMEGLLQTMPDDPDTVVVVETTANGVGNPFHQDWERATDTSRNSEWLAVFFAWHEHPEYSRWLDIGRAPFDDSVSKEERELQDRFRLSLEQLNWRRWCIENKCQGDVERFRQEYPAFPEQAFRASGRAFFSFTHLGRMPTIEPAIVGELAEDWTGTRRELWLQPADRGALAIYRKPEQGHLYTIGADQAYGVDINKGEGTADPDFSSASVLDINSGEQVAQLRARFTPTHFGEYVERLARWYYNAYLVPEGGALGKAMIEELLRRHYPPSLIFAHRPDLLRGNITSYVLGYEVNQVTRAQLLAKLQRAILEMSVIIRDRTTLQQCRTFVIKPDGKPEHQEGCHDDDVFSLAYGVVGIESFPSQHRGPAEELKVRKYRDVPSRVRR